jgi:putative redox protein
MARGVAHIGKDIYKTQIEVGGHALVGDEPERNGGANTGPAPYDYLLAGLGACTAITLRMYADRKQWPMDGVDVALHLTHGDDQSLADQARLDIQPARLMPIKKNAWRKSLKKLP